jgi:sarcosine oxidase
MPDADVVVVGLGAMGSAAAHRLSARGARVTGFEQFGPAHDRGSSHGESRIIRQAYYEHPSYVPLVRRAFELWRSLEAESGRPLLTVTGGLMIGPAGSRTVAGSRLSAERWALPHRMLTAAQIRERFPAFAAGDGDVALYEAGAGLLDPEECVRAQLQRAGELGAVLAFGERVTGWRARVGGVEVTTEAATYRAGRLVLCPGAWADRLFGLNVSLRVERQVMHWFRPGAGTAQFAPDRFPIFIWEDPAGESLYGFPTRPGAPDVKVAFFRRPNGCDPDRVDRTVHAEEVAEISRYVGTRLPALSRHSRAVTCMYTLTADGHFVLGAHPDRPEVVVAGGFSGHGFKFAPVIGEVLADLVLTGRTDHDLSMFDPARTPTPPVPGPAR